MPDEGIVNLGGKELFGFDLVGCRGVTSGRGHRLPHGKGSRAQEAVIRRF
jgi:hypothetical protein